MDAVKWEPPSMLDATTDELGVSDNLLELVKDADLSDDIISQGKFRNFFRFFVLHCKCVQF